VVLRNPEGRLIVELELPVLEVREVKEVTVTTEVDVVVALDVLVEEGPLVAEPELPAVSVRVAPDADPVMLNC